MSAVALAAVEWKRVFRRKVLFVTSVILFLPTLIPLMSPGGNSWEDAIGSIIASLAIVSPLIATSLMADDLSDKTASYLFTRPLTRTTIYFGKLLTAAPLLAALTFLPVTLSFFFAFQDMGAHLVDYAYGLVGAAMAAGATAVVATAWGTLLKKRALPAAIGYLFLFDTLMGMIPFSLNQLTITKHVFDIAQGQELLQAIVVLAVQCTLWTLVGLWRFKKR